MELVKKNKKILQEQFQYLIDFDNGDLYLFKNDLNRLLPSLANELVYDNNSYGEIIALESALAVLLKNHNVDFFLWIIYVIKDYFIGGGSLNEDLLLQEIDLLTEMNRKIITLNEKYISLTNKKRKIMKKEK